MIHGNPKIGILNYFFFIPPARVAKNILVSIGFSTIIELMDIWFYRSNYNMLVIINLLIITFSKCSIHAKLVGLYFKHII